MDLGTKTSRPSFECKIRIKQIFGVDVRLNIKTDFPEVQKKLKKLRSDVRDKATVMALNRTMDQARTAMKREITGKYNMKSKKVTKRLFIKRASGKAATRSMSAGLMATGSRSMHIGAFLVRPTVGRPGGPQLGFRIRKGGPIVEVPGAFMHGKTIFRRVGKERYPIETIATIGVPSAFNQKAINANVVKVMRTKFPVIFNREVAFYISKMRR